MAAILVFIPCILSGLLLVHSLWPDRALWGLLLKACLGAGVGLGLRSLLYFIYLLILPGRGAFIYFDFAFMLCVVAVAAILERRRRPSSVSFRGLPQLTGLQRVLVLIGSVVFVISLLSTANYVLRRRQGDWDAWMMYNRAARFLYVDQVHWLGSFSPQMDPLFHADYPLLLAGNIAAGWDALDRDASSVPMLQSALFSISCAGLLAGALAATRSVGQAALGITVLWGLPVFVNEGARQMADVPMAFFILATGVLLYLFSLKGGIGLLALAGLTAGLAAWTKNEGSVLVLGAGVAFLIALRRQLSWRSVLSFAAGVAVPLAVVLVFKVFIAPPGDIVGAAAGGSLVQLTDLSRHTLILSYLWGEVTGFGAWQIAGLAIGVLPILALYYAVFRSPVPLQLRPAVTAGLAMLGIQLLGYYVAYLVSPYDLAWHLSYSSTRIVVQIFPLLLFLTLCATLKVETVFGDRSPLAME